MVEINENLFGLIIAGSIFLALAVGTLAGSVIEADDSTNPWWEPLIMVAWLIGGGLSAVLSVCFIIIGFKAGVS
jgi:type IV secretory pathway VirB2 component (pilin)